MPFLPGAFLLEEEENLKKMPEYRKLVKQYNDTGVFLMKFELQEQVIFYFWFNVFIPLNF